MLNDYVNGQTSVVLRFKLRNSAVTTGAGLTGLTFSSSSLRIATICDNEATSTSYTQAGSTIETITTLGTYAAPTSTKCRFKEVDATNHPGLYELHLADARFAVSSAKEITISVSGATNLAETDIKIPLRAVNPYDGTRFGMTALPNAAANANGGLPILSVSGTTLGYTISTLTTYTGNTVQTGDAYARIGAAGAGLTALGDTRIAHLDADISSITSGALSAAAVWAYSGGRTITGGTVTTYTGNTPQTGDAYARIGAAGVGLTAIVLGANAISTSTFATGTTIPRVTLADTLTTYTGNTVQTGDSYARIGAAGAGLTALGDTRIAHLDANVSSIAGGTLSAVDVWTYGGGRTITGGTIGTYTGNTPQTGDSFARIGSGGAGLTGIGDTRLAYLDAAISDTSTFDATIDHVKLDQSVALTDRIDATLGGALSGAWATAWGKVVKDVPGAHLKVWGPTNTTITPSIIYTLDDGSNPTTRTPP